MQFEVSGIELLEAIHKLNFLSSVGRTNLVLINALPNDVVELTYTNDLNILKIDLVAIVIEPGSTAVRADSLIAYIRTFKRVKDLMFNFTIDDTTCFITSAIQLGKGVSKREFKCECISSSKFPTIAIDSLDSVCSFDPSSIPYIKAIPRAINSEEARPELRGVKCAFDSDSLVFAATNGMLLLEGRVEAVKTPKLDFEVILNKDLFSAFINIFKAEENCDISINDNFITFYSKNMYLSGLLISGTYPRYLSYFDGLDLTFDIEKEVFSDNLNSVLSAAVKEDYYRVILKLESNKIIFDAGKAMSEHTCDLNVSGSFEIDLDGYLLKTALDACMGDLVHFGLKLAKDSSISSYIILETNCQKMLVVGLRKF